MNDNQAICLKCGVRKGDGNAFCANCGNPVQPDASVCLNCGVAIKAGGGFSGGASGDLAGQNKTTMVLLAFLLPLGIHNFMMGESKKGIARLLLDIIGIGWIFCWIDAFKILSGSYVVDPDKYLF